MNRDKSMVSARPRRQQAPRRPSAIRIDRDAYVVDLARRWRAASIELDRVRDAFLDFANDPARDHDPRRDEWNTLYAAIKPVEEKERSAAHALAHVAATALLGDA